MVPVVSATTVGGVPLTKLVAEGQDRRDGRAHARRAAASSSTCSGRRPGTRRVLRLRRWSTRSCSTRSACSRARRYLEGEYGIDGLYMGVPVKLGAAGIEQIVELDLDRRERGLSSKRVHSRRPGRRRRSDHPDLVDFGLRGRTAIVCGASEGIGLGARRGARRGGSERRDVRAAPRTARPRGRPPRSARACAATSTNPADLERLVEKTVEAFGGIDVLVNNSGGPPRTRGVELTDELVEEAVELLLLSVDQAHAAVPALPRQEPNGRIVNITSSTVKEPVDNLALSNVVRPGVIGWAKTLSRELGPQGITVNSIAPGRIDTARIREVYPGRPDGAGPPDDPAGTTRFATRGRRCRLLPRLCARVVRDGHRRVRRRRIDRELFELHSRSAAVFAGPALGRRTYSGPRRLPVTVWILPDRRATSSFRTARIPSRRSSRSKAGRTRKKRRHLLRRRARPQGDARSSGSFRASGMARRSFRQSRCDPRG